MMTKAYIALEQALVVARDDSGTWTATACLAGQQPHCVAVDPFRPERVYCGTFDQGLWRSDDAGETWRPVGAGIAHPAVMAVAVSPLEQAGGYGVVYAGTEPSALYRSINGGASWQEDQPLTTLPSSPEWSFPPRPHTHHVRWITPDQHVRGRLFACVEAGALVRSDDDGATWRDRTPDGPRDTHTLATHPRVAGRLYSAAGDGVLRSGDGYAESDDAGETWRRVADGLAHQYLWGVAVDPANPETVIISAAHSPEQAHHPLQANATLYRKTTGTAWQEARTGLPDTQGTIIPVLAAHQTESGTFYAASNKGLFRSGDAGETWERVPLPWPDHDRFHPVQGLVVTK